MPFRLVWIWAVCMVAAVALTVADRAGYDLSGALLAGVSTGLLYRLPEPDPATWARAQRETPLFRRQWAWVVSRPAWLQRVLVGLAPTAVVGLLAVAR